MRDAVLHTEGRFQTRIRMWKAQKALAWSQRGLHRARVHLTLHRHDSMESREKLAREMFSAGYSVIDVALAMREHVLQENADADRKYWISQRDYYQEMRRQWFVQRREWIREIRPL